MLNDKIDIQVITTITGYRRRQVFALRQRYLAEGISAIEDKRKKNPRELLTRKEREEIIETLTTKTPRDYRYESDYWTTSILGDFLERSYQVKYKSRTSYYLLFHQAKFTYHKPGRVYQRRDEEEVEEWRRETRPKLEEAFHDPEVVILVEDEMRLSTQTTVQKIWLPRGEYPRIEVSNERKKRSVYGFWNLKSGEEQAWKAERENMYITRDMLGAIREIYPIQRILLLWDGAKWHKGSEVQKFLEEDQNIRIIYFPGYAPEENPQEHVWKAGRSKVVHNRFIKDIDKATDEFIHYLLSLIHISEPTRPY